MQTFYHSLAASIIQVFLQLLSGNAEISFSVLELNFVLEHSLLGNWPKG